MDSIINAFNQIDIANRNACQKLFSQLTRTHEMYLTIDEDNKHLVALRPKSKSRLAPIEDFYRQIQINLRNWSMT